MPCIIVDMLGKHIKIRNMAGPQTGDHLLSSYRAMSLPSSQWPAMEPASLEMPSMLQPSPRMTYLQNVAHEDYRIADSTTHLKSKGQDVSYQKKLVETHV